MAEIKTKPDEYSLASLFDTLDNDQVTATNELIAIMSDVTGKEPQMWGASIVGFHSFHYKSKSGQEGDWPRIGFAPRKGKISLYLTFNAEEYLPQVNELGGKNSIGKGCIYLAKYDQVDKSKLRDLIKQAYKDTFIAYPKD